MAFRYDKGTLRPPRRLDDGRLIAEGRLTRSGVFDYRESDGTTRREYRPDSEVFKTDSLHTFALVPVTDDHPPKMLTAETAKEYAVGATGETVRRDGNFVTATLMVFDAETIRKMEQGKSELSCGYECDVDHTPGTAPDGTRYDAVQRNIRGNHVAIVDMARAGSEARVRMDAATMLNPSHTENAMDPEQLKKDLDAAKAEMAKMQARIDAFEKKAKAKDEEEDEEEDEEGGTKKKVPAFIKKKMDTLQAKLDDAEAKIKKLEGERTDSATRFDARVKERVSLLNTADRILGSTDENSERVDRADMSDRDLKIAVINHVRKTDNKFEGKSDDYIEARYDAAVEDAGDVNDALADVRSAAELGGNKKPGQRNDAQSAREAMIRDNQSAWQPKA